MQRTDGAWQDLAAATVDLVGPGAAWLGPFDAAGLVAEDGSVQVRVRAPSASAQLSIDLLQLVRMPQALASPDINGDGAVGGPDLATLLGDWGTREARSDLDGEGTVGAADLAMLLGAWTG
jgi:hypothetical protein